MTNDQLTESELTRLIWGLKAEGFHPRLLAGLIELEQRRNADELADIRLLTLLHCPFCGAEAHFDSVSAQVMSEERVYAGACTECSCEIMNGPIRNYAGSGWYETKEAAAEDWNRRTALQGGAA